MTIDLNDAELHEVYMAMWTHFKTLAAEKSIYLPSTRTALEKIVAAWRATGE